MMNPLTSMVQFSPLIYHCGCGMGQVYVLVVPCDYFMA